MFLIGESGRTASPMVLTKVWQTGTSESGL